MTLVAAGLPLADADDVSSAEPAAGETAAAVRVRGAELYQTHCADCHGQQAEGVEGAYSEPLIGDASVAELARIIDQTMPEGEPEICTGDDALAVAQFLFEAHYSEAAQMRKVPPRAALARLTAQQYRHSLADLYAHFAGEASLTEERGLSATYFDHPGWNNDKKVTTRVEPQIDVNFGTAAPGEGLRETEFAIYWSGALLPPVSGQYVIRARGEGSFQVKFIDPDAVFIDNHVSSGEMAEHERSVYLTAGRQYPLNVQLIKRPRKTGNVPISLTLSWKPPRGVEEPIPTRYLFPNWTPRGFAPQTPFPPDDRSAGYQRGVTVSREWQEAVAAGALEFADAVSQQLWPRYRREAEKQDDGPRGRALLIQFLAQLQHAAHRGFDTAAAPRTDSDAAGDSLLIQAILEATPNEEEAIRQAVLVTLASPYFLYPTIDWQLPEQLRPSDDAIRASRLALVLWDSLPNRSLLEAGEKGWLGDEAAVRKRAQQMIDDPRAKTKLLDGLQEWLDLARWEEISKNQAVTPGFDQSLVGDLRQSLELFLEDIVESEASDFRQFFLADWSYTSQRLADFYGPAWQPTEAPPLSPLQPGRFARTAADANRHGVLTHPLLLSAMAYADASSPIHRGVFLTRHMLGRLLRPPTDAFSPLSPDLHPDLTTRQRVALQTSPAECMTCHARINPLGFTLEGFDAVGRLRQTDGSHPVDASGGYTDRQGQEQQFDGAADLAAYLATSDDSVRAFIRKMFLHFVKQPVGAYGENCLEQLETRFVESGYNVKQLIVEIAVIAADPPQANQTNLAHHPSIPPTGDTDHVN